MNTKITKELIKSWKPCYSEAELKTALEKLFGDKSELSAIDILKADDKIFLKPADRGWIVFRPEIIGEKNCFRVAHFSANNVLPLFEKEFPSDLRPRRALAVLERWIGDIATQVDLKIASEAAWGAARAARAASGAIYNYLQTLLTESEF